MLVFTDEDVNGLEPTRPGPGPSLGGAKLQRTIRVRRTDAQSRQQTVGVQLLEVLTLRTVHL